MRTVDWNEIAKPPKPVNGPMARLSKSIYIPKNAQELRNCLAALDRWDAAYFPAVPVTQSTKAAQ